MFYHDAPGQGADKDEVLASIARFQQHDGKLVEVKQLPFLSWKAVGQG